MAVNRTIVTRAGGSSSRSASRSANLILSDYKRFSGKVNEELFDIIDGVTKEIVLPKAIEYAPFETGALKESGRAGAERTKRGVIGVVSFGGPDYPVTPTKNTTKNGIVNYAVVVHENVNSTGYKFLERAGMDTKQEVEDRIISRLKAIEP